MDQNLYMMISGMTPEEMSFLQGMMKDLTEDQQKQFLMIYQSKRREPQMMLLLACIGFVGAAGIQRFVIGEIGMGVLYLLTGGLCLIGTIIDIVNHKTLALPYNQKMAYETLQMMKMMS